MARRRVKKKGTTPGLCSICSGRGSTGTASGSHCAAGTLGKGNIGPGPVYWGTAVERRLNTAGRRAGPGLRPGLRRTTWQYEPSRGRKEGEESPESALSAAAHRDWPEFDSESLAAGSAVTAVSMFKLWFRVSGYIMMERES